MALGVLRRIFAHPYTHRYIGEPLDIHSHSWQCFHIAHRDGCSSTMCMAAFLHDIGHWSRVGGGKIHVYEPIEPENGDDQHEWHGERVCQLLGMPNEVGRLIRLHTKAKRYLRWKSPHYQTTTASTFTSYRQGGKMSAEEAIMFEQTPFFHESLVLRQIDDQGKDSNSTPSIDWGLIQYHMNKLHLEPIRAIEIVQD